MVKQIARGLWYGEPILLFFMLLAFWTPSPIRDQWLWLLGLLPVVWGARWIATRRLWPYTPLQGWIIALLVLGVLNVQFAPATRGLIMLGRPLFGVALYLYFIEYVAKYKKLSGLIHATTLLALVVGAMGLFTTQWNNKSDQLGVLVDALPNFTNLPGLEGGLNANELAGALIWLLPVMAALAAYRWRVRLPRWGVTLAFLALFAALYLGQSRLAIIGLLVALAVVARLVIPAGRWRHLALIALIVAGMLEVLIINNVFNVTNQTRMRARDEASFSDRVDIWRSGLAIIRDYPLTGFGMSMFRYNPARQLYPVAKYTNRILPHAHNEWIQLGSDLGLPGLTVFAGLHLAAGYLLLAGYRRGDDETKALAVGVAAGLLGHLAFGVGDAIPLWDRFAFIFWWLLALAGASYLAAGKPLQVNG